MATIPISGATPPVLPHLALAPPSVSTAGGGPASAVSDGSPAAAANAFGTALGQAVSNLQAVQNQANQSAMKLATGQPVNIHDVMINAEQANISFQLALQVRNKVLDAYLQLIRMQI